MKNVTNYKVENLKRTASNLFYLLLCYFIFLWVVYDKVKFQYMNILTIATLIVSIVYIYINMLSFKYTYYLLLSKVMQSIIFSSSGLLFTYYVLIFEFNQSVFSVGVTFLNILLITIFILEIKTINKNKIIKHCFNNNILNSDKKVFYIEADANVDLELIHDKSDKRVNLERVFKNMMIPLLSVLFPFILYFSFKADYSLIGYKIILLAILGYILAIVGWSTLVAEYMSIFFVFRKIERKLDRKVTNIF